MDAKPVFWDIHGFAAQNRFQLTPKYKISLKHFIYIPTAPYQSIGMVILTALHAHRMHITCSSHAHHMHTAFALHAHWTCMACTSLDKQMFTACPLHMHCMCFTCTLHMSCMHPAIERHAYCMCTSCAPHPLHNPPHMLTCTLHSWCTSFCNVNLKETIDILHARNRQDLKITL